MNAYYKHNWSNFYSNVAGSYDAKVKLLARLLGGEDSFHREAIQMLALPEHAAVLDMGCGTGSFAIAVAKSLDDRASVLGIDLCPEMIARAHEKAASHRLLFRTLDALNTDLPAQSFNAVTIIAVLHEFPFDQRQKLLIEARRVLKADGKLLVGEHYVSDRAFYRLFQLCIFRLISKRPERLTFKDLIRRGLPSELASAGFRVSAKKVLPLQFFHVLVARPIV